LPTSSSERIPRRKRIQRKQDSASSAERIEINETASQSAGPQGERRFLDRKIQPWGGVVFVEGARRWGSGGVGEEEAWRGEGKVAAAEGGEGVAASDGEANKATELARERSQRGRGCEADGVRSLSEIF
jgi:hypothetical protein